MYCIPCCLKSPQCNIWSFWNNCVMTIPLLFISTNQEKWFHQRSTNSSYTLFWTPLIFQSTNQTFFQGQTSIVGNPCVLRSTDTSNMHSTPYSQAVQWHICSNLLVITDRWLLIIFLYGCQESDRLKGFAWTKIRLPDFGVKNVMFLGL